MITERGADKMGEQKDLNSPPLVKSPNLQLTAEWKRLTPTKKDILYIHRRRRSHNEMIEGAHLWCNQISFLPGGQPTKWKIFISQRFSLGEWEFWAPHVRLPSLSLTLDGEAPRAFDFEGQELHRTGRNRNSTPGGCNVLCALGKWAQGKKQWLHRRLGHMYPLELQGVLGRWRRQLWLPEGAKKTI